MDGSLKERGGAGGGEVSGPVPGHSGPSDGDRGAEGIGRDQERARGG